MLFYFDEKGNVIHECFLFLHVYRTAHKGTKRENYKRKIIPEKVLCESLPSLQKLRKKGPSAPSRISFHMWESGPTAKTFHP
jgi:hypothetical protein